MFSGRRSARSDAGPPVGARIAASVSGKTGVGVFSGKVRNPRSRQSQAMSPIFPEEMRIGLAARLTIAVDVGGSVAPSGDANRVSASPTLFNIEVAAATTARSTCADSQQEPQMAAAPTEI